MKKLTQAKLKELLHYNQSTGIFHWKVNRGGTARAGDVAGCLSSRGYVEVSIYNKGYRAHRLAWLYVHGYMPEHGLDHINRKKTDNRIHNLREVSQSCNRINSKAPKNNTSGVVGVYYVKAIKKYDAQISINNKCVRLGQYRTKREAAKARWEAEVKYGYPNCNTSSSSYQYLTKEVPEGSL